ncbi:MAG: glycosyl transferase family 2 [Crocinitomicaceae bacterium]|nr:glycosyl transferase family 2 [Crocinitomicaceae bacterium]
MIILDQIGVHLPQGYLFKKINLQINKGEKVGLVGKNGAGKSTLLNIIAKKQDASEGKIILSKDSTIGFLTQDIIIESNESVFEYLNQSNKELNKISFRLNEINHELVTRTDYESASYLSLLDELTELNDSFSLLDGYTWKERISNTLKGLGFKENELEKPLNKFSGGWKMRAELAKILVNKPDVLLLDEPTNHLDIISISWLEEYLQKFEGIVILISHDRLFLDNITKRTLEISLEKILDFPYAYTKYKAIREEEIERTILAKKQQDKDIKQTEVLINKFRAKKNKAAFAQSLIKKLEKTEKIEVEKDSISKLKLTFPLSVQPGKWVLELIDMGKRFDQNLIFKNINITVGRGEKIALLGPNGVGKTTLLNRIMGLLKGDGEVNLGHNVNISYFSQNKAEELDPELSVYDTVDKTAIGEIRKDLRSVLGAFLFKGDDVLKKVKVLSGGERTRLALCQLLLSPSNFLILDEPTNHLDIASKEVLKSALKNYQGTFIVVSHDREFLQDLTNRIWEIDKHTLKIHHYSVQQFIKEKQNHTQVQTIPKKEVKKNVKNSNKSKVNPGKIEKEIRQIEKKISKLEELQKKIQEEMNSLDYSDEEKSNNVISNFQNNKKELDLLMDKWEELMSKSS